MADELLRTLAAHGCEGSEAGVFIESFEPGILRSLSRRTRLPLVQLLEAAGSPYSPEVESRWCTYAELASHYQTIVLPTRTAKPRDKAAVEAGVLTALRGQLWGAPPDSCSWASVPLDP